MASKGTYKKKNQPNKETGCNIAKYVSITSCNLAFALFVFIVIQQVRAPLFGAFEGLLSPPFGNLCMVAA